MPFTLQGVPRMPEPTARFNRCAKQEVAMGHISQVHYITRPVTHEPHAFTAESGVSADEQA